MSHHDGTMTASALFMEHLYMLYTNVLGVVLLCSMFLTIPHWSLLSL